MTDEKLASLAQQSDVQAELELFNRYRNTITKYSRGFYLIGGDVEDLIQEGMIGLYKAIKSYDSNKSASFATFANLCIKRQIQSAVRNASTQKNLVLSSAVPITDEENDELGIFLISDGLSPEQVLANRQVYAELKAAFAKELSPLEHTVLRFYLQGLSYQQIADKTGQTKKSIDNALSRIKKKIGQIRKNLFD